MKNKKIFEFLKVIINILYFASMMMIGGYIGIKYIELEFIEFFSILLVAMLGICIVYFISIIWHELGHLFFGIKAKLKFISFSVLNFIITKENNKLTIKKTPTMPGIGGYCNMEFDEDTEYNKRKITNFFLGGIIFNIVFVLLFSILLIFCNSTYLNIIIISFIVTNLYMALYNSMPFITVSGGNTDMLHIINCYKDAEYIKVLSRADKIQNLLSNGCELKEIDENLFYMPKDFSNSSKVLMAQLYIDYIAEKEQYKEAIEHIKTILKTTENTLPKSHIILFKINLIYYAFKGGFNLEIISEYWNKDIRKYLEAMGNFEPQFIGINYMYSSLIEKDKKKAQSYLKQFEQIKKKHPNKESIEETEKTILDVNERLMVK